MSSQFDLVRAIGPCLAYCGALALEPVSPVHVPTAFRSAELEVAARTVLPQSCFTEASESLIAAFASFVQQRELVARGRACPPDFSAAECRRPRSLLVTDWNASLFDGALTPDTQGFIGEDGIPAWDTWLGLVQAPASVGSICLMSWVPEWLADGVDLVIQIDAAESLSWLRLDSSGRVSLNGWGEPWTRPAG